MTPKQREALELYESGLTMRQVGAALGISQVAVLDRLRRAGFTPRPAGEWYVMCKQGHDMRIVGKQVRPDGKKNGCKKCREWYTERYLGLGGTRTQRARAARIANRTKENTSWPE